MKKILIGLLVLGSISTFASQASGTCQVTGISDKSSDNTELHKFYRHNHGKTTLDECLNHFEKGINYIKRCGVVVSGTIHYAELEFNVKGRILKTVETIGISCI